MNSSPETGSEDGLIVLDFDQRVIHWSNGAAALLGLDVGHALGRPIIDLLGENLPEFSPPEFLDNLVEAISSPGPVPKEVRAVIGSQDPLLLEIEVFRSIMDRLPHSTALLLRDLTAARGSGSQRETFFSNLSHELLEHLTAIVGWADLLLREESISQIQKEGLEAIFRRGQSLEQAIRDFLSVGCGYVNNLRAGIRPLDLAEVIQSSVTSVFSAAVSQQIVLEVESDLPPVLADREMLEQVLQNLLGNALKYSPPDGRITVSARHEPTMNRVTVSVRDEGEGLGPEDLDLMFARFRTTNPPGSETIGGADPALYVVSQFVARMGGVAWVGRPVGGGATFYFTLPSS